MGENKFKEILGTLDEATQEHSSRVAILATYIYDELKEYKPDQNKSGEADVHEKLLKGLEGISREDVFKSAYLHDIGKVVVPSPILNYPGNLSSYRYDVIKEHPKAGAEIIRKFEKLGVDERGALEHHENLNGKGYPLNKKEDDISVIGKIIAVADRFEAMSAKRIYQPTKDIETAKGIMINEEVMIDKKVEKNKLEHILVNLLFNKLDKLEEKYKKESGNLVNNQDKSKEYMHKYYDILDRDVAKMLNNIIGKESQVGKKGGESINRSTPVVCLNLQDKNQYKFSDTRTIENTDPNQKEASRYDSDISRLMKIMDKEEDKEYIAEYYTNTIIQHYGIGKKDGNGKVTEKSPFDIALGENFLKIYEYDINKANMSDNERTEKFVDMVLAKIDIEQQMQELSSVVKQLRKVHKEKLTEDKHPVLKSNYNTGDYNASIDEMLKKREYYKYFRRQNISSLKDEVEKAKECSSQLEKKAQTEKNAIGAYMEVKDKIAKALLEKGHEYERVVISPKDDGNFEFEVKLKDSNTCLVFDNDGNQVRGLNKSEFSDEVLKNSMKVEDDDEKLKGAIGNLGGRINKYKFAGKDMETLKEHLKMGARYDKYLEKVTEKGRELAGFNNEIAHAI